MPQVEDVYTNDETTMFVKYKEIGTFSYSYFIKIQRLWKVSAQMEKIDQQAISR